MGTSPPLSRSSPITVDSAISSLFDMALRRYPTVVPARLAKDSCAASPPVLPSALRNVRKGSISMAAINGTLPYSKAVSTPFGHSICPGALKNDAMASPDLRRRRLKLLIQEFGSQRALAEACGYQSDNYISQLLKDWKAFSEKAARRIEKGAGKPEGWLDIDEDSDRSPRQPWPFSFDRTMWDRLSRTRQLELERQFETSILGASLQEAAVATNRRRQG